MSIRNCKCSGAFTETPLLWPLGIFVWGDALIFAPFWLLIAASILYFQNWNVGVLIFTIFWTVRSIGETMYWFNQQFSTITRNPPERLKGFHLVQSDAVWYLYQIFWQCIAVISIVGSIYFGAIWIGSIF
jgi:hypothetical protein